MAEEWEDWKGLQVLVNGGDDVRATIARGELEDFERIFGAKYNNFAAVEVDPDGFSWKAPGGSEFNKVVLRKAIEISHFSMGCKETITLPIWYSDRRNYPVLIMHKADEVIAIAPIVREYTSLKYYTSFQHFFEQPPEGSKKVIP